MPKYVIAYHGGKKIDSPQESAAHMGKWKAWVSGLGDPAQLVRQRPDVRSSEELLHSASANIGVAVRRLSPQVSNV